MDDRLEKALEHANYKISLNRARKNLLLKFRSDLIFAQNGGTFSITAEFLSFVDLLARTNNTEAVLIDDKENPIEIEDMVEFRDKALSLYHEASNTYLLGYSALKKARTVKSIAGK